MIMIKNKHTLTALFLKIDPSPILCFQSLFSIYTVSICKKERKNTILSNSTAQNMNYSSMYVRER